MHTRTSLAGGRFGRTANFANLTHGNYLRPHCTNLAKIEKFAKIAAGDGPWVAMEDGRPWFK